jgi:tetratricopeptide (TPR) repeat protein
MDEAIAAYREAIRLNPEFDIAWRNLGAALAGKGFLDEAVAACREAIRINPNCAGAHFNLGGALWKQGKLDEAIGAYHVVIRLDRDDADSHNDLGSILHAKGDDEGACAEWRETIRVDKNHAAAHCNLGRWLMGRGQFAEALIHLRRAHELNPEVHSQAAQWLKRCETFLELEPRLPAILAGKDQPADAGQWADYASLCQEKGLFVAAARLYREAMMARPDLAALPADGLRYNAACSAAVASCGVVKDAVRPTDAERAGLRRQALDWLRADLDARCSFLDKQPVKARPEVARQMQHWLHDSDFNGMRGPEALGKLPEAERGDWLKLWQAVEALRKRAAASS